MIEFLFFFSQKKGKKELQLILIDIWHGFGTVCNKVHNYKSGSSINTPELCASAILGKTRFFCWKQNLMSP